MTEKDKQTEEKIFDAATEVFTKKGLDGARMQDIADHAGINKALLHYYFRTKDHLFDAVFQKLAAKLFMKFAAVFEENMTLEEKIRYFFREHITFMQENPGLPAFVLNEINHNPGRIKKILAHIDFNNLWKMLITKHSYELQKYNITMESIPQIITSIVAISVFPFAARGILEGIFANLGVDFDSFIEERKDFAAGFVLKALTK